MKLSELQKCFAGNEVAYAEFSVLLVDLDRVPSDGVDVVISPLREVEIDGGTGEMRLYSAAQRADSNGVPAALFESFSQTWPLPGVYDVDFVVKVQLPIAPDDPQGQRPELAPLAAVWIGRESEEIWLLVRDIAEYPEDLLPG
jgi:hypothetical protein